MVSTTGVTYKVKQGGVQAREGGSRTQIQGLGILAPRQCFHGRQQPRGLGILRLSGGRVRVRVGHRGGEQ